MTTRKIGNDLPGSYFNRGHNDTRRDRAVRRLMFHHTGNKKALLDFITLGSAGETFRKSDGAFAERTAGALDDQGNPTFSGGLLVHPEDTSLPLQTTKVTRVGKDRWTAVLTYYRIPTTEAGGPDGPGDGDDASNAGSLVKLRVEFEPHKVYTDGSAGGTYDDFRAYSLPGGEMIMNTQANCEPADPDDEGFYGDDDEGDGDSGGGDAPTESASPALNPSASPQAYSRVVMLPVTRILIPFAYPFVPFTQTDYVGCLNQKPVYFGGYGQQNLYLDQGECRFDGVQMEELGSFVDANGQSARFFGSYMFTASPTTFFEQVPRWCKGRWTVQLERQNINDSGTWNDFSTLGLT